MDELEKIKKEKTKRLMEKIRSDKMETEIEVNDENFQEKVIRQSERIPVLFLPRRERARVRGTSPEVGPPLASLPLVERRFVVTALQKPRVPL